MDKAVVVFSRKGVLKEVVNARDVRSREHARKLWPLVDPHARDQLVTWVSPSFENGRPKRRSYFRRLPDTTGFDFKRRFDEEEAERQHKAAESQEHFKAKELLFAELQRRLKANLALPWAFRDENASDFPIRGNLLLGAKEIETEYKLKTPFGCEYRLDIAILGSPIEKYPLLVGAVEIERWHQFDGRKALIGRSLGFPLITVDISEMQLGELTEDWARRILTDTTRNHEKGRRSSYVYIHNLLYPQFVAIPPKVEDDTRHQYLVFASDQTITRLTKWLNRLAGALGYAQGKIALQKLNGKSQSARVALKNAGSIVGPGWEEFNDQRLLRVTVPRPSGPHDEQAHKLHATLAKLLLTQDCLVGYQYANNILNEDPEEDVWLKFRWRREHERHEIYRILPKRLAESMGRLVAFLNEIGPPKSPLTMGN